MNQKALMVLFGVENLKNHLLMASKDVCANNFKGNFDELFKDIKLKTLVTL